MVFKSLQILRSRWKKMFVFFFVFFFMAVSLYFSYKVPLQVTREHTTVFRYPELHVLPHCTQKAGERCRMLRPVNTVGWCHLWVRLCIHSAEGHCGLSLPESRVTVALAAPGNPKMQDLWRAQQASKRPTACPHSEGRLSNRLSTSEELIQPS